MGLETGDFINQLVETNPQSGDALSLGDDHLRLLKHVLKTTFPNMSAAMLLTAAELNVIPTTYAPLASPALTGTPTTSTAAQGTDTTQIANCAFTNAAVMGSLGRMMPVSTAGSLALTTAHLGKHIRATAAGLSLSLGTAAALGAGWWAMVSVAAGASLTLSSIAANMYSVDNTVTAASSAVLPETGTLDNTAYMVVCDGVSFYLLRTGVTPIVPAAASVVTPGVRYVEAGGPATTPYATMTEVINRAIDRTGTYRTRLDIVGGNSFSPRYRIYKNGAAFGTLWAGDAVPTRLEDLAFAQGDTLQVFAKNFDAMTVRLFLGFAGEVVPHPEPLILGVR